VVGDHRSDRLSGDNCQHPDGFDPDQRVGDVERDIEAIRACIARRFKNATVTIVLGPERKRGEEISAAA